ncbi:MAG: prenyltransferase [Deltaproteobacteria bacterium]|nr:prenyltransferase [Deltaproteobacteria bacterium]
MTARAVLAFVRLGRPLFLGGGFILYAIGAAVAAATGHAIAWHRYALGQLCVTSFQLMTHYANDYFDLETDRANTTPTAWSGGSRVLLDGALSPRVALVAALVLAGIGGVSSFVLGRALATLAAIAVLAWSYSAPPLRLCARGLGEVTTALVVTVLVPLLGFQLQAPDWRGLPLLALSIAPLALLQFAMLVAIEFPDAAGDAATGKRTLVVQLGTRRAATLYILTTLGAFALAPAAYSLGLPGLTAIAIAVPAPLAMWRIARLDVTAYDTLTFWGVALLVLTSACVLGSWLMNSSTLASS